MKTNIYVLCSDLCVLELQGVKIKQSHFLNKRSKEQSNIAPWWSKLKVVGTGAGRYVNVCDIKLFDYTHYSFAVQV